MALLHLLLALCLSSLSAIYMLPVVLLEPPPPAPTVDACAIPTGAGAPTEAICNATAAAGSGRGQRVEAVKAQLKALLGRVSLRRIPCATECDPAVSAASAASADAPAACEQALNNTPQPACPAALLTNPAPPWAKRPALQVSTCDARTGLCVCRSGFSCPFFTPARELPGLTPVAHPLP